MRVLILGGTGMLGHKLAQILAPDFETIIAVRGEAADLRATMPASRIVTGVDVRDTGRLTALLDELQPAAILNAAGIVKQVLDHSNRVETIEVNALFPNVLAELCVANRVRLIHYSTDCVFSGAENSIRGERGYREDDPPDSRDLYGLSKYLGEPSGPGALVLRTSMIGRELRGRVGLLEWFLNQGDNQINGYTRALFTGLPTLELACLTKIVLQNHADLSGIWHVASDPISKYDLLCLIREAYGRETRIARYDAFYCDRRLDGTAFAAQTGWRAAPWRELVAAMRDDPSESR